MLGHFSIYPMCPQCSSTVSHLCSLPCSCKSDTSCFQSLHQICTLNFNQKGGCSCSPDIISGQVLMNSRKYSSVVRETMFSGNIAFYLKVLIILHIPAFPHCQLNKQINNLSQARDICLDLWRCKYLLMAGLHPPAQTSCRDFCLLP